jgi:hypothetical protein
MPRPSEYVENFGSRPGKHPHVSRFPEGKETDRLGKRRDELAHRMAEPRTDEVAAE